MLITHLTASNWKELDLIRSVVEAQAEATGPKENSCHTLAILFLKTKKTSCGKVTASSDLIEKVIESIHQAGAKAQSRSTKLG